MTDTQPTDQKNDTGYVPGDDLFTRCRNYFVGITGGMTEEGIKQYRIDRDIRNEDKDCRRCEEQRDYILQYSRSPRLASRLLRFPIVRNR